MRKRSIYFIVWEVQSPVIAITLFSEKSSVLILYRATILSNLHVTYRSAVTSTSTIFTESIKWVIFLLSMFQYMI